MRLSLFQHTYNQYIQIHTKIIYFALSCIEACRRISIWRNNCCIWKLVVLQIFKKIYFRLKAFWLIRLEENCFILPFLKKKNDLPVEYDIDIMYILMGTNQHRHVYRTYWRERVQYSSACLLHLHICKKTMSIVNIVCTYWYTGGTCHDDVK